MKKKTVISPKDFKFLEQKPYGDPGFDPEQNARVIAEVDAWNDEMDRKRDRDFKASLSERTSAIAQYLRNVSQGKGVSTPNEYFGRRHLAYLRGEEVVRQLKENPVLVEKLKNGMAGKGQLMPL